MAFYCSYKEMTMVAILVMASPSNRNQLSQAFLQKLESPSILSGYFAVHVCMLIQNRIDHIS